MANVQESTVTLTGSVRRISTETGKDNKLYGTVQIENKGGISDVRLNADATAQLLDPITGLKPGDEITWTVRPSLWNGTSQRTGKPYTIFSIRFVSAGDDLHA